LQDVTNDKFTYPYNGKRYRDKFLKIELPDGREGWVFNGGIHLKQKVGYIKRWIEVPDTRPDLMQNFKFANFKGKVMRYAIAKDLYQEIIESDVKDIQKLETYLAQAKEGDYTKILRKVLNELKKGAHAVNPKLESESKLHSIYKGLGEEDEQVRGILQNLIAGVANKLIEKKQIKIKETPAEKEEYIEEEIVIGAPDFSDFSRITNINSTTSSKTLNKAEIIVNTNPILREETVFPFPKRSNADFHLNIPLKSTTTATLKLGTQLINLFLQPGDDLTAAIEGNDLYSGLSFTGIGSDINNYLVAAANKFRHIEIELKRKIQYATPDEFKSYLKQVEINKLNYLEEYLGTHTLSEKMANYAKADIEYWYAFNLMNYPYEHPIYQNKPTPMDVPGNYYDFLGEVPLNNSVAIPNTYYLYFIQDYLSFVAPFKENKDLSRFDLADKYLKGETLYFYKSLQHSIAIKQDNNPSIAKDAYYFIKNCPNKLYGEYVKLAYQESRGMAEGMNAPDFNLVDVDGNMVSLSDYKGKVVFLDFWATWCQPCKRLLPAHQKLQNQFKNDSVVFLYVSMDRSANKWRNYLAKGTFPGKHLFSNKTMTKSYKVETLPYSVLIDADGKIVWQHTGGFSVQRTAQRILDLLQ